MIKYQITEVTKGLNHAGTKATADIATIAEECGFEKVFIRMEDTKVGFLNKLKRQITFFFDWINCYRTISENSIVLLQNPFHYPQLIRNNILYELKNKKHVKFISLAHDVEELRGFRNNEYYKNEFIVMMDIADYIIVHNDVMKDWFVSKGISKERLITLDIFDYLQNNEVISKKFIKQVIIAGNLDVKKSNYISQLNKLKNINFKLYGPNFSSELENATNITYGGVCAPEEIILKLNAGFGLVWDGDSIDTCSGDAGNYLRYNNPHKLSMYLSAGLPVIIWKEAAEAGFVERNKVGILVNSLSELDHKFAELTLSQYKEMCDNANEISVKLKGGYFFKQAILNTRF